MLFILKVGSTLPDLKERKGDFEDWVIEKLPPGADRCEVIDIRNGGALPEYGRVSGLIITGSHDMVTEHQDWSERAAEWLRGLAGRDIPVLGICYGHQLLAYALGGEVGNNPNGREFGTVPIQLAAGITGDALLGGMESPIRAHVCHTQSVLKLPQGAKRLAWSGREHNQAFAWGKCAWGVQFHPEFDAEVVRTYIKRYRAILRAEGQQVDRLLAGCQDTPLGTEIFRRFAAVVPNQLAM